MKSLINFTIILWIMNLPFIIVLLSQNKEKENHPLEIYMISCSSFLFMISYLFYKRSIVSDTYNKAKVLLSFTNIFHLLLLLFYIHQTTMKISLLFIATVTYMSLPLIINMIEIVRVYFN
jgi:hypothetical protein